MKIKIEHYKYMESSISNVPLGDIYDALDELKTNDRIKDIKLALRWQVMRMAGLSNFVCDELYKYVNDSHIDTALRAIMARFNLDNIGGKL